MQICLYSVLYLEEWFMNDELTIYDKYPNDLLNLDQVILKKDFDKEYTLEEIYEQYKDHFKEDLGDSIAFRVSNEEGEIVYEEDCNSIAIGSIDFLESEEIKNKLVTEIHVHNDYYQDPNLMKPCLE